MAVTAKVTIVLLSLCVLSVDAIRSVPAVTGDAPDFCHNADCPKFTTKEEHDEYEIREYEEGVTRRSTRRCGPTLPAATVVSGLYQSLSCRSAGVQSHCAYRLGVPMHDMARMTLSQRISAGGPTAYFCVHNLVPIATPISSS